MHLDCVFQSPEILPEHSIESNLVGARMGAGILECDVVATADGHLVCRHSQCDLHTTTDIVAVPILNKKCTVPFRPAGCQLRDTIVVNESSFGKESPSRVQGS